MTNLWSFLYMVLSFIPVRTGPQSAAGCAETRISMCEQKPTMLKTAWSATYKVTHYCKHYRARLEMWTVTKPANVREMMIEDYLVASPKEVEQWRKRSSVGDSVWPLSRKKTAAVYNVDGPNGRSTHAAFKDEGQDWKEVDLFFQFPEGTNVLLISKPVRWD